MNRNTIPILAGCYLSVAGIGCSTIQASSRNYLTKDGSRLQIAANQDPVRQRLTLLFRERGIRLVDKLEVDEKSRILVFKGDRMVMNVIGTQGTDIVASSSDPIGSIIYVRVISHDENVTRLVFLGKPTVGGRPVCSRFDWEEYKCNGVRTGIAWPGRDHTRGREEAELIRGVVLELKDAFE